MANYWILKSEPGEYSFDDLIKDKVTKWDGVRNYQARNNLRAMVVGDHALIYHSVSEKAVIGIAEISKSHYPDPADNPKGDWVVVEVKPVRKLKQVITLETLKADAKINHIPLIKQSRLSVIPLTKKDFDYLVKLGG